jgi:hypothetical protein
MLTTNARRARRIAGWAGIACAALLVTACNSSGSSAVASVSSAPATQSAPATHPSAPPPTGTSTFLAQGQDINGTLLHRPACNSGCPLSGDSTAILDKMTWRTWSATEAVGTGTYKLDGCDPNCAAGPVYPVATVVTLSNPVKVCSSSGTRWVWTRASFSFPHGLPKALRGTNGPTNPWVFSTLTSAARQSCAG